MTTLTDRNARNLAAVNAITDTDAAKDAIEAAELATEAAQAVEHAATSTHPAALRQWRTALNAAKDAIEAAELATEAAASGDVRMARSLRNRAKQKAEYSLVLIERATA